MRQKTRIVAMGDSVTAGCPFSGVTPERCYVALASQRLAEAGLEAEWITSALEGVDTAYAVKRFHRLATVHEPDLVLVMLGLNDAQPPGHRPPVAPAEYLRNLLGLVERIMAIDARPVLATPTPRPADATDQPPLAPYAAAVRQAGDHFQIGYIDPYRRLLELGHTETLVPDGTHPAQPAHILVGELVAEHIAGLLGLGALPPVCERSPLAPSSATR